MTSCRKPGSPSLRSGRGGRQVPSTHPVLKDSSFKRTTKEVLGAVDCGDTTVPGQDRRRGALGTELPCHSGQIAVDWGWIGAWRTCPRPKRSYAHSCPHDVHGP